MNYSYTYTESQAQNNEIPGMMHIPSLLYGFHNTTTTTGHSRSGRTVFCLEGEIELPEEERICSCGQRMHLQGSRPLTLRHLCVGGNLSCVRFPRARLHCPCCGASKMQNVLFQAPGHRITAELYEYTRCLLSYGTYTNKEVAEITGLGENTVKDIDLERLKEKYTVDGKTLAKPEKTTGFLCIDEFKLHDGYKFATHIIDMETGHILWIAQGKKKQVVYDFIEHVGLEWMSHVQAVACDMNSDFEEAFREKCPHIQPVFDHFHIVKNFNEKVVSAIRKDEHKRLLEEGNTQAAQALKGSRYILTSNRSTLRKKDEEARSGKVVAKGSALFGSEDRKRTEGYEARYDELLNQNKLLFTCDLVKEKLASAYACDSRDKMETELAELLVLCAGSKHDYLIDFAYMITTHFDGISAHALYGISSGRIEGINNKIKSLRRQAYGYPDDEYFLLKLLDMSRSVYIHNAISYKVCD